MMKECAYGICALFFGLIVGRTSAAVAAESEWKNAVGTVKPAVVNIAAETIDKKSRMLGSGFIFDKSGYIVTNDHVIKDADTLQIKLYDGRVFSAKIIGMDALTDIAVIKINAGGDLPVIKFGDSESLALGEKVAAIGNPFGQEHTLTTGIVSMRKMTISDTVFIQTDAEINPGNSGGPLINMRGEAVGINAAIIKDKTGKGYAVPINTVRFVMNDLIAMGRVERGWLGIRTQPLTPQLAESLGLASTEGVMIIDIVKGSPADSAGLKNGDIILQLNRMGVSDTTALQSMITSMKPGQAALFMVYSGGKKMFIAAKLGRMPATESATTASPVVPEKASATSKSDVDDPPQVKSKQDKNAYAIVIGIEQYRQKLPKADFAAHDAKIVSEYLTKTMGYPEENVITLIGDRALKSDMEKYFDRWLSNNVEENGRVFIYYSGHGAPDTKSGGAYLVPYDGDPSFIAETGYPIARLYESLGKLKAKEIIVVLDSCFSGAGGRSVLAKGARPLVMNLQSNIALSRNMTVLSASSGEQISSTYDEKGHGLFTYFLLKGIKNEDVVKQDGSIKMDDLFGYIKPQVERIARRQYNNEQTPQLMGAKK